MRGSMLSAILAMFVSLGWVGGWEAEPPPRVAPKTTYRIPGGEFRPRELASVAALPAAQRGWGLGENGVNVPAAWAITKGRGATVAILDTGIDAKHPEFRGRTIPQRDFTGSATGTVDIVGHGTHCAGIVGMGENGVGYVGVAPESQLVAAKVLGDDGSGQFDWLAPAIRWAVEEQHAHVISLSLGAYDPRPVEAFYPELRDVLRNVTQRGVIVVAAAGNDHPARPVGYPGLFPEVICVAASKPDRTVAPFSSRGPRGAVDVAAPGQDIVSCIPGNRYAEWDGTSMATPMVAGVAALYVARCKDLGRKPSQEEFVSILRESARSQVPRAERPSEAAGWGLIQAGPFVDRTPDAPPAERKLSLSRPDFTAEGWRKLTRTLPGFKQLDLTLEPLVELP